MTSDSKKSGMAVAVVKENVTIEGSFTHFCLE